MVSSNDERLDFWESRSSLGIAAGSGDVNLKNLEINAITKSLASPSSILDAGCGNGFTLSSLAFSFPDCSLYGFDYSEGMVNAAADLLKDKGLSHRVSVCKASLLDSFPDALSRLKVPAPGFDFIYTERSIINLDNLEQQAQAVKSLWSMLRPGGRLILCEAFIDGLNEINSFREAVGLPSITPPWHNRYLSLSELNAILPDHDLAYKIVEFSGTYYFVSRVVHAREASLEGREPSYGAAINQQSLDMPPLPLFGQSKIIIFDKK